MKNPPSVTLASLRPLIEDDPKYASFPDPDLHTPAEQAECIRIRTENARHFVKLVTAAQKSGKLPTSREFLARAMELELASAFGA